MGVVNTATTSISFEPHGLMVGFVAGFTCARPSCNVPLRIHKNRIYHVKREYLDEAGNVVRELTILGLGGCEKPAVLWPEPHPLQ